ncbi:5-methyltetrahydropteroyltriglutamate--homocysteine S-methyltransferase [Nocardioides zeae]|uniref:5-methyltetrahydropteroyltriglutamate--homocysteine methyltransferase n=1 Tax=Nocardioides zeae TaxID=1457234 RepID=A0A6P0HEV1_9ACTN|nr:5-methyltetrahydropteroyltriglutamate--homocysteine S-methyltransferase [Nocardioides zeae]NEN77259.1 5-methyltetrahydropteroyltriglutamate--homocysteine S-methyltransferase [Nocardioides zeae]
MSTTQSPPRPIGATVLGYPRIGRHRELKRTLEAYWRGQATAADVDRTASAVRHDALATMSAAGLDSVPVNTFSLYDQLLDTVMLLGAVPPRFTNVGGGASASGTDLDLYFAMARGTDDQQPLEMTKWFDTNYHYLVPEIGAATPFALDARKPLLEHAEAVAAGVRSRPVVVGPWTFLSLAKSAADAPSTFTPLDRLTELAEVYADLLRALADAGVEWVQIDEPALVRDLDATALARVHQVYRRLGELSERPAMLVATYFGDATDALAAVCSARVDGIALDLVAGSPAPPPARVFGTTQVVLGAVDGRNVWRTDLEQRLGELRAWQALPGALSVSSSCSLLHVPYDVSVETGLNPAVRASVAFADQKLGEVVALQRALSGEGSDDPGARAAFAGSAGASRTRAADLGRGRDEVAQRVAAIRADDRRREPVEVRRVAQAHRLRLPALPTTTIGSFPQTDAVRSARAAHRAGRIDDATYEERMQAEIADVVALQESLGLDVLVHGEPERNDMVQYFAELLGGFATTGSGWVQSYGTRCVRPPLLHGDVTRPQPMTVRWTRYAASLTDRPMKGMLTGPVTILAWSFVRDDQPRATTADQVALALRDEVADLEAAGVPIIQVDEPALRELLPLRRAAQQAYLEWAVAAFRLATSGVRADTQVHTHLCYSEFGEVIDAIDGLGADVTSVEAARSGMELLADVALHGFAGALGPGVYDIHSPRVPSADDMAALLRAATRALSPEQLWVNPDCGLKTRGYAEVRPALAHLVEAAARVRAELEEAAG